MRNVKLPISFLSISIAWAVNCIIFSIGSAWMRGMAKDSGVFIFWSGLFMLLAWAIFIIYPIQKLDHSKILFKPAIFPFATGLYAAVTFTLLVGGFFRDIEVILHFILWAFFAGIVFGFVYIRLIRSGKFIEWLGSSFLLKVSCFLSPAFIVFVFLWIFPSLLPSNAFRYMPDEIRDGILIHTIPKYRVGDSFTKLREDLPYYFDDFNGGTETFMPGFQFHLKVDKDKITELTFTYNLSLEDESTQVQNKLHK